MKTTSTCIAAVAVDGRVWIGGDSAGVGGLSICTRADRKVFSKTDSSGNKFGFGFTSSFRMGQLLNYELALPRLEGALDAYMVKCFIPAVRKLLRDGGYSKIENNEEHGGCFIVGVCGRIFEIFSDFQVGENAYGYAALGCGEDLALGSLHTTKAAMKRSPRKRLTLALEAAQEFSAGVRAPFHIIHV